MPIKEITEAFSLDRIVPFFQPIMDINANRVWRYECLARLVSEQEDTFLPNEFLCLVERNNWIQALTETMVLQSAHYFRHINVPWNINLSTQDLLNPNLLPFLHDLLQEYPNRQRISLELTAQTVLAHQTEFTEFVHTCQRLGIGIFIDNLDDQPSDVPALLEMPINGIKISEELIHHFNDNGTIHDFIEATCDQAKQHSVTLIAERIEEPSSLEILRQLSIHYAQGFYFCRPQNTI